MAELKTTPTKQSVKAFIDAIADETKRQDARALVKLMKAATGTAPKLWGPNIVGFGSYHYRYDSGREGDWFLTGFSPRSTSLVLYIMAGFSRYGALMKQLGKHKTGKSCLYIKRLSNVDLDVLGELVTESVRYVREKK